MVLVQQSIRHAHTEKHRYTNKKRTAWHARETSVPPARRR